MKQTIWIMPIAIIPIVDIFNKDDINDGDDEPSRYCCLSDLYGAPTDFDFPNDKGHPVFSQMIVERLMEKYSKVGPFELEGFDPH